MFQRRKPCSQLRLLQWTAVAPSVLAPPHHLSCRLDLQNQGHALDTSRSLPSPTRHRALSSGRLARSSSLDLDLLSCQLATLPWVSSRSQEVCHWGARLWPPSGLAWVAGWVLAWTGHLRAWAQSSQAVGKGGAGGDNRAGALSVSPITEGWAGPAFSVCVCVCARACVHAPTCMQGAGRGGA